MTSIKSCAKPSASRAFAARDNASGFASILFLNSSAARWPGWVTSNSAGADNLGSKILIDIANDLEFTQGTPPRLLSSDEPGTSVGKKIQAAFPNLKVVKSLSTMNAFIMLNPSLVNRNDAKAKKAVNGILEFFGRKDIMNLGNITASRSVEMMLPVRLRTWGAIGNTPFNFKIVR